MQRLPVSREPSYAGKQKYFSLSYGVTGKNMLF